MRSGDNCRWRRFFNLSNYEMKENDDVSDNVKHKQEAKFADKVFVFNPMRGIFDFLLVEKEVEPWMVIDTSIIVLRYMGMIFCVLVRSCTPSLCKTIAHRLPFVPGNDNPLNLPRLLGYSYLSKTRKNFDAKYTQIPKSSM